MSDSTMSRWEQFTEAAQLFLRDGSLAQAEEAIRGAIEAAEQSSGGSRLARSFGHLAQLRFQQGNAAECDAAIRRALEAAEGDDSPDQTLPAALDHLATLVMGRDAGGEAILERLLAIGERRLGAEHSGLSITLNNLARLQFKRGDYEHAEPLLRRLLTIKRRDARDQVELAAVYASLGKLLLARRQLDEAEECWRFALAIREQSLPGKDAALATTLEGLAEVCEAQGKRGQAAQMRERALTLREEALGPEQARAAELRNKSTEARPQQTNSLEQLMYFPPKPEWKREARQPPVPPQQATQLKAEKPKAQPLKALPPKAQPPKAQASVHKRSSLGQRSPKRRRRRTGASGRRAVTLERRHVKRRRAGGRMRRLAGLGALLALCGFGGWTLRGAFGPEANIAWLVATALAHGSGEPNTPMPITSPTARPPVRSAASLKGAQPLDDSVRTSAESARSRPMRR